ncbi:MAG: aminoglycoside phosphotransferase family protein, partial [Chloroflexota bacterium]
AASRSMDKLHADEVETTSELVRQLISEQFPEYKNLPITLNGSSGTDNVLYRLGDELVVRLPRVEWATAQIDKDKNWLPILAPQLPIDIPEQIAVGSPSADYPFNWSIYRWISGHTANVDTVPNPDQTATDLACFIKALRVIDPAGGPTDGYRGQQVRLRDEGTRQSLQEMDDLIDLEKALQIWDECLTAADWDGPSTWFHGDLMPGNILFENGKLKAIIDFGVLGVGDPAVDLMVAWFLLPAKSRPIFRQAMGVGEDEWLRGKAWALSISAVYVPYYRHTNLPGVAFCLRALHEILDEANHGS